MSLDAKLIHAILAEKDLGAALSAGITTEWFEDPISSAAYAKIIDYSKMIDASGQVPGRSYLEQLGLIPFGQHDGSETLMQLVEAKRLDRLRKLIMSATGDITGTIFSDPEASLQALLKSLNSKEIQALTTHGRKNSLQSLTPTLYDWYSSSLNTSADVTSTLVIGSAPTTNQRTDVGDSATASSTRLRNSSELAKNRGASQRKSTNPGITLASGWRAVSW